MKTALFFEEFEFYQRIIDATPVAQYCEKMGIQLLFHLQVGKEPFVAFIIRFQGEVYTMNNQALFAIKEEIFRENNIDNLSDLIRDLALMALIDDDTLFCAFEAAPQSGRTIMFHENLNIRAGD